MDTQHPTLNEYLAAIALLAMLINIVHNNSIQQKMDEVTYRYASGEEAGVKGCNIGYPQ